MAFRQKYTPNVRVAGQRGWCLKYVDDAGNAPARRPTAKAAYEAERKAKRIRTSTPPKGVWVVGFLSFGRVYQDYGHVFLMKYLGGDRYEIRDSETAAGARAVYTSITSIKQWFANYAPAYLGWSTHCDGRQYAHWVKPAPKPAPKRKAKRGTATLLVNGLNVRNKPSLSGKVVAVYKKKGEKFNYDSYIDAEGYRWLSYISWTGQRRYVAQASKDKKTKYVKGGV